MKKLRLLSANKRSITAAANAIACRLTDDELNLLGTVLTQLADTLFTIAAQRSISENSCK